MQLVAFKGIVMITTRYIGLRQLFVQLLSSKQIKNPSESDISNLWRNGTVESDLEWNFFLDYAAYCISAPDEITRTVEKMKPSQFGCFESGLCISDSLSHWIYK